MSVIAYIALGSNQGDKITTCRRAIELLKKSGQVTRVSSFFCTEPVGYPDQEDFINVVVELETDLSPLALLAACHVVEDALGRSRLVRWGPRTIDLDILMYSDEIIDTAELSIPHPLMTSRAFVLVPLCEIAPQAVHPKSLKSVDQLLRELQDTHWVRKCNS
jgi:2-amino-4-hydroxy-6-hydroxymethyldihydropteridine diphosphokinase